MSLKGRFSACDVKVNLLCSCHEVDAKLADCGRRKCSVIRQVSLAIHGSTAVIILELLSARLKR